jgi:hypothetical protein
VLPSDEPAVKRRRMLRIGGLRGFA